MKKTDLQKKWEKIEGEPGWVPVKDPAVLAKIKARNAALKEAKDAKINMRLPEGDLLAFKKVALERGIPYQTLLGSVIKMYASGMLVEQRAPARVATKKRA